MARDIGLADVVRQLHDMAQDHEEIAADLESGAIGVRGLCATVKWAVSISKSRSGYSIKSTLISNKFNLHLSGHGLLSFPELRDR